MPFTPFHLGPALCLGSPLREYIHAPTLILANVVLDIEPLIMLITGLSYPLYGYLHTHLLPLSAKRFLVDKACNLMGREFFIQV